MMAPDEIERALKDPDHKIFSQEARQKINLLLKIPELKFYLSSFGRLTDQKHIRVYLSSAMHYLDVYGDGSHEWHGFDIDGYHWPSSISGVLEYCFHRYSIDGSQREPAIGQAILKHLDLLR